MTAKVVHLLERKAYHRGRLTKADDLSETFKTIQCSNRYIPAHVVDGNYLI